MATHYCISNPCYLCYPSLVPKQQCVIDFAISKETLDKVWEAICEGMIKEQESFSNKTLKGSV